MPAACRSQGGPLYTSTQPNTSESEAQRVQGAQVRPFDNHVPNVGWCNLCRWVLRETNAAIVSSAASSTRWLSSTMRSGAGLPKKLIYWHRRSKSYCPLPVSTTMHDFTTCLSQPSSSCVRLPCRTCRARLHWHNSKRRKRTEATGAAAVTTRPTTALQRKVTPRLPVPCALLQRACVRSWVKGACAGRVRCTACNCSLCRPNS